MPKLKQFDQEKTLEKAMELFWKKGFFDTSMQDLVTNLKISRSSIYDTFGGKRTLFLKAFNLYKKTSIGQLEQFLKSQRNVKIGLEKLFSLAIQESLADVDKKGCFIVNTATELATKDEEIKTILADNQATLTTIFYNFIELGEKRGEYKKGKDLDAIANLLFVLYNGIRVVTKFDNSPNDLNDSVRLALSLLD